MRKLALLLTALLLAALMVPGLALAQAKEIKIGAIYPLTGGAAAEGRELRAGVELAVEIANGVMTGIDMDMAKNGGVKSMGGAKITVIFKDHQGNPQLGADLAKKLIEDDKVVGILGCYHSSVTKTVAAVCERFEIPMITTPPPAPPLPRAASSGSGAPRPMTPSSPRTCSSS